jgi:hypothetical protein
MARIVALNECAEVELDEALWLLREAAAARGATDEAPEGTRNTANAGTAGGFESDTGSERRADDELEVLAALRDIPNPDLSWHDWNYLGMAIWGATGGSAAGLAAFAAWSARASKNNKQATEARWMHYATSPPTQIGAGTIFHLAAAARRLAQENAEAITATAQRKKAAEGGGAAAEPVDLWAKFAPPEAPEGMLPPVIE